MSTDAPDYRSDPSGLARAQAWLDRHGEGLPVEYRRNPALRTALHDTFGRPLAFYFRERDAYLGREVTDAAPSTDDPAALSHPT